MSTSDLDPGPELPPEMIDAVIDQVYASNPFPQKLLGICSLVSKSWLPRSRRHLFEWLVIDRFLRMKSFLTLLESPLCTFKPHVQILELAEGSCAIWKNNSIRWKDTQFPILPAVRDLSICDGTPDTLNLKTLVNFSNLQFLGFYRCWFSSSAQLFDVLSPCTSLKNIVFASSEVSHVDDSIAALPCSLRSVDLRDTLVDLACVVLKKLASGGRDLEIETIKLSLVEEIEIQPLGHCLRALGPSLKYLKLWYKVGFRTEWEGISL
jgi:hypothetical protein